jgi:hypothetical protein
MRSFSLVLLRRLLFRPAPSTIQTRHSHPSPRLTLYDHLSSQTLTTLERLLLHSLLHEPAAQVCRKTVDTVCDIANQGMMRGRPWHALQAQVFNMAQAQGDSKGAGGVGLRECAYKVLAGCPNLVMDLHTDAVLATFQRGLQDGHSIEVCRKVFLTIPFNDEYIGPTCRSSRLSRLSDSCGRLSIVQIHNPTFSYARHPSRTCLLSLRNARGYILVPDVQLSSSLHLFLCPHSPVHDPPYPFRTTSTCTFDLPSCTDTATRGLRAHADSGEAISRKQWI